MNKLSLAGNINGNSLVLDEKTGFLTASEGYSLTGFNVEKKLRFVELAPGLWPHITRLCEVVQISRSTYQNHYKIDKGFREAVDNAREQALDEAEWAMRQRSTAPGGFMDRIALLKAYRPERWNPEHKLTIQHDVTLTRSLAERARQFIPAEAVPPQGNE